jgi:hypothetical protein
MGPVAIDTAQAESNNRWEDHSVASMVQEQSTDYLGKVYNISNQDMFHHIEYLSSELTDRMEYPNQIVTSLTHEEITIFKNISIIINNIKTLLRKGKSFIVVESGNAGSKRIYVETT